MTLTFPLVFAMRNGFSSPPDIFIFRDSRRWRRWFEWRMPTRPPRSVWIGVLRKQQVKDLVNPAIFNFLINTLGELEVKCAYLLYENLELDIAIFALSPTESSWPTYVEYSQLLATDKFDYLSTFANQNVFSVGYATPIDYRYIEYWKNFKLLYQNEPLVKDNIDVSEVIC